MIEGLGRVVGGCFGTMVLLAFYGIFLPLGVMYVVLCICRFIPLTGWRKRK
jgi:hypothetical protein